MKTITSRADGRPVILAAGSLLDHDAPTLVRAAAAAGFDGFGLRLSGEHVLPSDRRVDELRRIADDLDLAIHDGEVIRIDRTWSPTNALPDSARRLLETAARIGAGAILAVSDVADEARTGEAVAALVDAATPLGLDVGLEYMAWTTPATPAGAVAMAAATGCRVVVDVLHHVRVGAGIDELRAVVDAGHLGWMQICDAATADAVEPAAVDSVALVWEARHGRLPPGHGALPLTELLATVPADTVICVEVQSDELLGLDAEERAHLLANTTRALV